MVHSALYTLLVPCALQSSSCDRLLELAVAGGTHAIQLLVPCALRSSSCDTLLELAVAGGTHAIQTAPPDSACNVCVRACVGV